MYLTVLAVADCPNAPILDDRLAAVLDGQAGVPVSHELISDEGEAARWGMHGSPTLLIDGADPFAQPRQPPSMSCRLYRDDSGQPSVSQLHQAIEQALATTVEPKEPAWLDSIGRGGPGPHRPRRQRVRWAIGIGLLRVHELLRHPRGCGGVGSLPSGDHRRNPGPGRRPAGRHQHLRPVAPLRSR
jgi:hypothetical protein